VLLALFLAAHVSGGSCSALKAAAKPAIEKANSQFIRQLQAGDAAAIAEAYADDGLFIGPDGATLKGKAAVRDLYAASIARRASIVGGGIKTEGEACSDDGMVYEWGQGSVSTRGADGKIASRAGPYLTVWKAGPDGVWKIIRNLSF
jgi:uncharacterized protein (TIGR02246 family)